MSSDHHDGRIRDLSPTLADGTPVESLIDRDRRLVSMRVLSDPEVYELEMERLFARTWVAVAHESEIPKPGDFVTRYIGQDPVIVTRDGSGEVQILLNVCSHRGMQVCRAEIGNAMRFQCPYHGWVYDQAGTLRGVPVEKEMFGDCLDKANLGLQRARVGTCVGMIFGTWDPETPSLDDYLGDYRWYLEAVFARTDGAMVVAGPPQRWRVHANWKLAAESFAGDAYHTLTLHRSMQDLGLFGGVTPEAQRTILVGTNVTANGHGLRCADAGAIWRQFETATGDGDDDAVETKMTLKQKFGAVPPPGMSPDLVAEMERHLSPGQLQLLADAPPVVGTLFPNLSFLNLHMPAPDGRLGAVISWRLWHPRGPGELDILSWAMVERDASEDVANLTRRTTIQTFSDSGIFEQDDTEGWSAIQTAANGAMGRRRTLNYQSATGEKRPSDWEGGGLVQNDYSRDDNQWAFWLKWFDFMAGKPW